ncbi:MAG: 30S ribosomal protein S24e [Thermoplasmata archaeon]|nr:30S ribosomal protein S24e [Thermoplasmata archaeon]
MELEIISRKENVLLGRFEVEFRVPHPKERTPKRSVVRGQIAEALGLPKMQVVIDHMETRYGISETRGYAKGYRESATMLRIEREHILKRNGITVDASGRATDAPEEAEEGSAPSGKGEKGKTADEEKEDE